MNKVPNWLMIVFYVLFSAFITDKMLDAFVFTKAEAQTLKDDPKHLQTTVKVYRGDGHGSGTIISPTRIVTAAHVVDDAEYVSVKLYDGRIYTAKVLWTSKEYDITMLAFETEQPLVMMRLSCRQIVKPEKVKAIGHPYDQEWVTSYGTTRMVDMQPTGWWKNVYIADIFVLPGMSGGPVMDNENKLIGVTVGFGFGRPEHSFTPQLTSFVVPSFTVCQLMAEHNKKGMD